MIRISYLASRVSHVVSGMLYVVSRIWYLVLLTIAPNDEHRESSIEHLRVVIRVVCAQNIPYSVNNFQKISFFVKIFQILPGLCVFGHKKLFSCNKGLLASVCCLQTSRRMRGDCFVCKTGGSRGWKLCKAFCLSCLRIDRVNVAGVRENEVGSKRD